MSDKPSWLQDDSVPLASSPNAPQYGAMNETNSRAVVFATWGFRIVTMLLCILMLATAVVGVSI